MTSPAWQRVHEHIESILPQIENPASGGIPYPYLSPAYGPPYGGFFFHWDHAHMAMRFSHAGRHEYLRHSVDNMLHYQRPDGFAPFHLSAAAGAVGVSTDYHAQPFMMQEAAMYLQRTRDIAWARSRWDGLQRYLAFYDTHHRTQHGLYRWPSAAHVSGLDNDVVATFFSPGTIIPADLNAWLYREHLAAADIADQLGEQDALGKYAGRAQQLRLAINTWLWNEDAHTFNAFDLCADAPVLQFNDPYIASSIGRYAFQSCSNLIPLYARVAPQEQGRAMLKKYVLSEEHFLSTWGIRSLSRSSEFYNNAVWGNPPRYGDHRMLTTSNWQGPIWIPLCYFMAHALADYGLVDEANDLADRTINLLAHALECTGSFTENYHGDTGQPLYSPRFASWNILADILHAEIETKAANRVTQPATC